MIFNFFLGFKKSVPTINIIIETDFISSQHKHQKITYSTPLTIQPEEWDNEKQRPKNIYLKKNKCINIKLNELAILITEYSKHELKTGKPFPQKTLIKQIKKIYSQKELKYSELSLLYFINLYIEEKKELISHSTYKRYKVFLHLIQRFEGFIKERIYIDQLTHNFVKKFILFGKEELYSENTIYRSIKFIKTILNFAERRGIRTFVRDLEVRKERQAQEVVTLTEKEIITINKTNVPIELQPAKDWLIISCYTGQRISDFMNFSAEKIIEIEGKKCIHFIQKKTKKNMILPLHKNVLNVITRNEGKFPQKIDPCIYNEQIRSIAKIAQLNKITTVRKRIGFRALIQSSEKWQTLTSHIGRRSFATIFYGRIPTPLLMQATGHTTEKMFLKYINPTDHSRILNLSRYFDKMYRKSNDSIVNKHL